MILLASQQHIFKAAFEILYGSLVLQFLHCVSNQNEKITGKPSFYYKHKAVGIESTSAADCTFIRFVGLGSIIVC